MARDKTYYGYTIVLLASAIMVLQWSVIYSFGVFFKPLLDEFGWSRAAASGAFSVYSSLSGFTAIFAGCLNDRVGPRFVMSLCATLLGIGSLLVSQAHSLPCFYLVFGGIIGFAMSGQFAPLMSTVARWFTARRGAMSGIVAAGVGIGALIGPQISNQLVLHLGWRTAFRTIGLAAAALIFVCAQFLRREPLPGEAGQTEPTAKKGLFKDQPERLTHRQATRSPRYWLLMFTAFAYGYCLFSLTVHIVAHAIDAGASPTSAVSFLSVFGVLSVFGKVFFGRLADRIGCRRTMISGFSMVMLAFILLAASRQIWVIYPAVALFGFFYGSITVTQSPLTAILFGLQCHGLILGVAGLSVTLGGAAGPYLTGHLFDCSGSYRPAFTACAAIALLGALASAAIKQQRVFPPPT